MAQRHQRHRGFLLALSAVQRQQKEAEQQQQQQQQHAPPTVRGETPAPRSSHERSSAAAPTRPFSAPLVDTPSIPLPSPQLQLVLRWPVALRVGSAAGVDGWVLREKLQSRLSAAIVDGSLRAAPVDKEDGAAVGMAGTAG